MANPQAANYVFTFYDRNWDIVYSTGEYLSCSGQIGINIPGYLHLELESSNPANDIIDVGYKVQVSRTPPYLSSFTTHVIFEGELERVGIKDSSGKISYNYVFTGGLAVLQRAIVGYKAGRVAGSSFTSDSIADILGFVIATNSYSALGDRVRTPAIPDVIVYANGAPSPDITLTYKCAWRNVYDVVQELLSVGNFDIKTVIDTTFDAWAITPYWDGLGSDKTDLVLLSKYNGLLPEYQTVTNRNDFKTAAIVGGGGQEDARTVEVRTGNEYNATYRNSEVFVDARQTTNTVELQSIGDSRLRASEKRNNYSLDISQNDLHIFFDSTNTQGLYYYLGDTVSVLVNDAKQSQRIMTASFKMSAGEHEKLTLTMENV